MASSVRLFGGVAGTGNAFQRQKRQFLNGFCIDGYFRRRPNLVNAEIAELVRLEVKASSSCQSEMCCRLLRRVRSTSCWRGENNWQDGSGTLGTLIKKRRWARPVSASSHFRRRSFQATVCSAIHVSGLLKSAVKNQSVAASAACSERFHPFRS